MISRIMSDNSRITARSAMITKHFCSILSSILDDNDKLACILRYKGNHDHEWITMLHDVSLVIMGDHL